MSCVLSRLRYLLRKAENEEVCREELLAHLGYVVNVIDSAFSEESKLVSIFYLLRLSVDKF